MVFVLVIYMKHDFWSIYATIPKMYWERENIATNFIFFQYYFFIPVRSIFLFQYIFLSYTSFKTSFLIEFVTSKNNALFFVHFLDELLLQFKTFSTKQYDFARTSSIPYCFPWWLLWRWQHESKVLFYTNLYSLMHILLLQRFLHFSLLPL